MKISEFIKNLQKIQDKNGDLDVLLEVAERGDYVSTESITEDILYVGKDFRDSQANENKKYLIIKGE